MDALARWRGKRVLVTGATGFVGRHVAAQGLEAGVEVHNLSSGDTAPAGIIHHRATLEDRSAIFRIIEEVKPGAVLHLAAAGVTFGTHALDRLLAANVLGTENLLSAVQALDTPVPVVLAGTCIEYRMQDRPIREDDPIEPFSEYGVSKGAASLVASSYATRLPITVLRLFTLYGPGEVEPRFTAHVIGSAKRHAAVALTACEQTRDYLYVGDAARSFWQALGVAPPEGRLQVVNVGSGEPVRLRSFVGELAGILRDFGLDPDLRFGAKPYRPGEPMMIVSDPTRACTVLGWKPRVSLHDGLRRTVESML